MKHEVLFKVLAQGECSAFAHLLPSLSHWLLGRRAPRSDRCIASQLSQPREQMHACMQAGWSWGWVGLDPTGPGWAGPVRSSPCSPIVLLNFQTIPPPPVTVVAEAEEQEQMRVLRGKRSPTTHDLLSTCVLDHRFACLLVYQVSYSFSLCPSLPPLETSMCVCMRVYARMCMCIFTYVRACVTLNACRTKPAHYVTNLGRHSSSHRAGARGTSDGVGRLAGFWL